IKACQRHSIAIDAWWFPTEFNDEAKLILATIERHHITPQLWITGGGMPVKSAEEQNARVDAEVRRIRPIAEAAATIGCKVGLYNHENWFGDPDNQIAILRNLNMRNVGIVYNFHHAFADVDRFEELFMRIKPYLLAVNVNGMVRNGNKTGQQIMPIGQGQLELGWLRFVRNSGWHGPIGILNHTGEDAEARLRDNLEGLGWLVQQLDGQTAGIRPTPRSWRPQPK
ncbi:MAG: sugar phosphate isomerase/epimerase family protein, partial [Gemmataceae bacterium]